MSEVFLFNHIPKTAGSTMKHVLWGVVGGGRVLFSTTIGSHREHVDAIRERLDRGDGPYAVVAHTGFGLQQRLPVQHTYRTFTVLRDPVQRTVSEFYYARDDRGNLRSEMSMEEFLEEDLLRSFNSHTAFLGGLTLQHHLDGLPLSRDQFDRALLERAKRNLETHHVVGLTERFDETLLLLRKEYGWPVLRTLYRPANVGSGRRAAPRLTPHEMEAVRASNELDLELFEFGRQLFESRLAERLPANARQVRRFRRLNRAYRRTYPVAHPSARVLARSVGRLRSR